MKVGQIVRIQGDTENNAYRVAGIDATTKRMWLSVTDLDYDGYNGDLIVPINPEPFGRYILLCDQRCNVPSPFKFEDRSETSPS